MKAVSHLDLTRAMGDVSAKGSEPIFYLVAASGTESFPEFPTLSRMGEWLKHGWGRC